MFFTELTAPAAELVTVAELKQQLGIAHSDDDAVLTGLLVAARQWCEQETGAVFAQRTFRLSLDGFPEEIRLPVGPVTSIADVRYLDQSGAQQTLSSANYLTEMTPRRSRLVPAFGTVWPLTQERINSVEVDFTAGYTTGAEAAEQAIILLAKGAYDGSAGMGVAWDEPTLMAARALLSGFYLKGYA